MSMTRCRECGKEVSSSATKCPHCGCKNPGLSQNANSIIFLIALVIAVIVGVYMFSNLRSCQQELGRAGEDFEKASQELEKSIDEWEREYGP